MDDATAGIELLAKRTVGDMYRAAAKLRGENSSLRVELATVKAELRQLQRQSLGRGPTTDGRPPR